MEKCRDCRGLVALEQVYKRYKDGTVQCLRCAFEKGQMRAMSTWGR